MTDKVQALLAYVREAYPEVTHVFYNTAGAHRFCSDDFEDFGDEIKGELVDAAFASVSIVPAAFAFDATTYKIVRYYKDANKPKEIIQEGLYRFQAKEHCSSPDSKGDDWFDGFVEE